MNIQTASCTKTIIQLPKPSLKVNLLKHIVEKKYKKNPIFNEYQNEHKQKSQTFLFLFACSFSKHEKSANIIFKDKEARERRPCSFSPIKKKKEYIIIEGLEGPGPNLLLK